MTADADISLLELLFLPKESDMLARLLASELCSPKMEENCIVLRRDMVRNMVCMSTTAIYTQLFSG